MRHGRSLAWVALASAVSHIVRVILRAFGVR